MRARGELRGLALASCTVGAMLFALLMPTGEALAQARAGKKGSGKAAAASKAGKASRPGKAGKAARRKTPKGKRAHPKKRPGKEKAKARVKVFDFTGLDLAGRLRTPQLIYFLDRAAQELELASLEKRSFVPEMVKSVDEESL